MDFDGTVGGNISGTSDLAPLDQQAAMLQRTVPGCKERRTCYTAPQKQTPSIR